jgi:hypothetical protein
VPIVFSGPCEGNQRESCEREDDNGIAKDEGGRNDSRICAEIEKGLAGHGLVAFFGEYDHQGTFREAIGFNPDRGLT